MSHHTVKLAHVFDMFAAYVQVSDAAQLTPSACGGGVVAACTHCAVRHQLLQTDYGMSDTRLSL
jgi:hypothetical protein